MMSQLQFFWARSMLFTVCGPQVDTLNYYIRLKCPTVFKIALVRVPLSVLLALVQIPAHLSFFFPFILFWCNKNSCMKHDWKSKRFQNKAQSDVRTMLYDSLFPGRKILCFDWENLFWVMKNTAGYHPGPVTPSTTDKAPLKDHRCQAFDFHQNNVQRKNCSQVWILFPSNVSQLTNAANPISIGAGSRCSAT